jgi:hypothetical protein
MLSEIRNVRQIEGEGTRRWFTDRYFDLIIWYDDSGMLSGFQLCYDKLGAERSFTWRRGRACHHDGIDAGEMPGHSGMTPVVVADSGSPESGVAERFLSESSAVEPQLARLVFDTITGRPSSVGLTSQAVSGEAAYGH